MPSGVYVGRFAPSPSGPLHFGSIVAAIGSYLDARAHQGRWLLRFDDLDGPRNVPGSSDLILSELERLGLDWDAAPVYQSQHPQRYQDALEELVNQGLAYPCACSRKVLGKGIYPGTCRNGLAPGSNAHSLRMRVAQTRIEFEDRLQGRYSRHLDQDPGDFVIHRGDGIIAYHLATIVDDGEARITHIVRGADLLASTPRQIYLQNCLGLSTPKYAHLPIARHPTGQKLSKQTHAPASNTVEATQLWRQSLAHLGQPSPDPEHLSISELREYGLRHWNLGQIPIQC